LHILSATLLLLSPLAHSFGGRCCFCFRLLRFLSATLLSLSPLAHSFGAAAFAFTPSAFFRRATLFSGGRRSFRFRL
jgi:hypothetical protein